jgi:hypothetical protein
MFATIHHVRMLLFVGVMGIAAVAPLRATESDLSVEIKGPVVAPLGKDVTVEVAYRNAGPDPVLYGYVNVAIPSGLPARIDELTMDEFEKLERSAVGTDDNGNTSHLFFDDQTCEGLIFQLQGPDPPGPMVGLDHPGSGGSLRFTLAIPEEPPVFGKLVIISPPRLAREYGPAFTRHSHYYDDGRSRYASGVDCNRSYGRCIDLDDCFGQRLAVMEPVTAELELVNATGSVDPHFGCGSLVGFSPGSVAVVRRGSCDFFIKAYYAQAAGAVGVIVVNDGRCGDLGPDNADCVVRMSGGSAGALVDIPIIMLSRGDGEPLIAELERGGPVTASMGAIPGGSFEVGANIFSADINEIDKNPENNGHSKRFTVGTFADGFDCGGCGGWSEVHWD